MAWDDNDLDDEDDDSGDVESSEDDSTSACPHCGKAVYDDAEQCPACGEYLSQEDAAATPRKWWVVVTAVICLVLAIAWALGLM